MKCPNCLSDSRVIDTREPKSARQYIRRRRECKKCDRRWTTYEISADELGLTGQVHVARVRDIMGVKRFDDRVGRELQQMASRLLQLSRVLNEGRKSNG